MRPLKPVKIICATAAVNSAQDGRFVGDERDCEQVAVVPEHAIAEIELGLVDPADQVVDGRGEREADACLGAGLDLRHRADAVTREEEDIGSDGSDGSVG